MNIHQSKRSKKGLYTLVLFLVISLVLNGVLYKNLFSEESRLQEETSSKLTKKDKEISSLEGTIKSLKTQIANSKTETREKLSKTELEKQQAYEEIAKQFITAYLTYDSSSLKERREKIKPITNEDLIDKIAPEENENDTSQLSSDPTFSSTVTSLNIYVANEEKEANSREIIADVSYEAKSTEGKTKVKTFIYMELKTQGDGAIKVNDYIYYPIN